MNVFIKAVCIASAMIAVATTHVKAEERIVPKPFSGMMRTSYMCKTELDLQEAITSISLGRAERPESCFNFKGSVYVGFTPLYWYETSKAYALVSRIVADGGAIAFVWIDFEMKEVAPEVEGDPV